MRQVPLSKLKDVTVVLLPTEACCVVNAITSILELLGTRKATYGPDGEVDLVELRGKIVDQIEMQRQVPDDGVSSTTPRK